MLTVNLLASVFVKYNRGLVYSIAPSSGVVRTVPEFNFRGAVEAVAVPAFMCKFAVGDVRPIPVLPEDTFNATVPFIA